MPGMESYPVPFTLDRDHAPRYALQNASLETVHWLRFDLTGPGLLDAPAVPRLEPGARCEFTLHGDDLPLDSRLIVRWLRASGEEYLWGVVF